ncbi:hypothetical protein PR003_g31056, partial [Phytophthora rubi]
MISAHCLDVLETPDYVVLGSGHSPGSSDPLDSAGDPPADGTSSHPLSVSDGSSAAGSEYEDGADGGSTDSLQSAPVKSSGKSRLRRAHIQSEDEYEDEDSDSAPLSSLRSGSSVPRGKMQSYLQAGRTPPGPPAESDDSGGDSGDGHSARSLLKKRKRKHKHKHTHKHTHRRKRQRRSPSPVPLQSARRSKKHKKRRTDSAGSSTGSQPLPTSAPLSSTPAASSSTGPARILFIDSHAHDRPELQAVLRPYACPLPGEEGYAEAASQLDEAAREVGFPPASSSQQESCLDSSLPVEFQEFADVEDSSLDFDGLGLQQISLVPYAASPTSSSAPATSPVGTPSPQTRVLNLSRGMTPLSVSAELSGVSPVDVVVEPAATSAESDTVTLSAALALPSTAEYPASVRWVPPASSSSAGSVSISGSTVQPTSGPATSGQVPSSAVARLLACSPQTKSALSKVRVPPSTSASSTVLTSVPVVASTSSRPTVPPASVALTSPSGRPIRAKAATARMISAHCLDVLETPDYVVLGSGHSPGSSDPLDSAGDPPADGTSSHPLSVSDGSSAAGSEYEDGADGGSTDSLQSAPVKSSGKSRLRRAHIQSED